MRSILGFIVLVISLVFLFSFDNALQTHPSSFTISTFQSSKVTRTFQQDDDGLSLPSCVRERLKDSSSYFNRTWIVSPSSPNNSKADNLAVYVTSYAGAVFTRQPFIREQLESAGLSASLTTGFDGKTLTDDDVKCWVSNIGQRDKDINIPGRAYLSQTLKIFAALYDIVQRDLPYGMTIDDDKFFETTTFKLKINNVLEEAPIGWHVIQFSKCFEGMRPQTWAGCAEHSKSLWRCTQPRCCDNNLYSNEGARMLLSLIPIDSVMDWLLWKPPGLQTLWIEPFASWEDKSVFPSVSNAEANVRS
jgi:hypothetical protein